MERLDHLVHGTSGEGGEVAGEPDPDVERDRRDPEITSRARPQRNNLISNHDNLIFDY